MNAALGIALLELAALGVLGVPLLAMQPGNGLSIVTSALAGAVLGRWILARWILPRWYSGALPDHGAMGEWVWSLGVGVGLAARTAGLLLAVGLLAGCTQAQVGWCALGVLLAACGLAGLRTRLWEGVLVLLFIGSLAYIWIVLSSSLGGGWDTYLKVFVGARKHLPLDLRSDAAANASLLSGLTLGTVQALVLLGADPLLRERLLRGGNLAAARRTLWTSLLYLLPLSLLVGIGVALFAWQERTPLEWSAGPDGRHWVERMRLLMGPQGIWVVALGWLALALHGSTAWLAHATDGARSMDRMRWLRAGILLSGLVALLFRNWPMQDAPETFAWLTRVAWGVLGGLLAAHWLGLRPKLGDGLWALALVASGAWALFAGATPGLRVIWITLALLWVGSRTLVEFFGHRRRLAALVDLAVVLAWLLFADWLSRHGRVPVERNPWHDEGWNWLPLASAWYVPLCGGAFFALNCWFARHRAD